MCFGISLTPVNLHLIHAPPICYTDVPILIPSEALSLDAYLGTGLQDSEEELPTDSSDSAVSRLFDARKPY